MNWKSSLSIAHGGTAARLVIMGPRNYVRHVCKHAICECLIRKLFFNHHYQVIGRAHQKAVCAASYGWRSVPKLTERMEILLRSCLACDWLKRRGENWLRRLRCSCSMKQRERHLAYIARGVSFGNEDTVNASNRLDRISVLPFVYHTTCVLLLGGVKSC